MALAAGSSCFAQPFRGAIDRGGRAVFPLGLYHTPKDDAGLRAVADAGFNLVRCNNRADLDRAQAAGLMGWLRLPLGETPAHVRAAVEAVVDHSALAVWEGPDELAWSFNFNWVAAVKANAGKPAAEVWNQAETLMRQSTAVAEAKLPAIREGIRLVREIDLRKRPVWFNEAADSDVQFVRGYINDVDVTGCDIYPIVGRNGPVVEFGDDLYPSPPGGRGVATVGDYTDRFRRIGRGRPVWMVLQGFSWSETADLKVPEVAYPSFAQSRTMAYDAIVHGARGIFYWGTALIPVGHEDFRESLYAVVRELSSLQPFLVAPDTAGVRVDLMDPRPMTLPEDRGVRAVARQAGDEWVVIVVNEDHRPHLGVAITGLTGLEGRPLHLLYGTERATIEGGELLTRLLPHETKVFATSRKWESKSRQGR